MDQQKVPEQKTKQKSSVGKVVTIVIFCFVAGFFGAWVFVETGLANLANTKTITNNRQEIVSQEGEIMADVANKVSPSVVSVTTQVVASSGYGASRVAQGAGTGMFISKDGYILTNKHVAQGAQKVSIVTNEGKVYSDVRVVGVDPLNDIAFLKVEGTSDTFTPVTFADSSQLKVGQKVIAIGNALGEYKNSVTSGIVSGLGRPILASDGEETGKLDNLIQTDAAINQGNSGGPLLNLTGEVVGMNTAVAEDAQGIGFAIPSNATKGLIKNLLATGKVERAYLGVRYINLNPQVAKEYNLSVTEGAYVFDDQNSGPAVISGSPADKAGVKSGDIITKVNDKTVTTNNGLALLLAQYAPGDKVTLTLTSDGKTTRTVEATLVGYSE